MRQPLHPPMPPQADHGSSVSVTGQSGVGVRGSPWPRRDVFHVEQGAADGSESRGVSCLIDAQASALRTPPEYRSPLEKTGMSKHAPVSAPVGVLRRSTWNRGYGRASAGNRRGRPPEPEGSRSAVAAATLEANLAWSRSPRILCGGVRGRTGRAVGAAASFHVKRTRRPAARTFHVEPSNGPQPQSGRFVGMPVRRGHRSAGGVISRIIATEAPSPRRISRRAEPELRPDPRAATGRPRVPAARSPPGGPRSPGSRPRTRP